MGLIKKKGKQTHSLRKQALQMKEKTPLPKKTSTPRKSILEKLSSSAENAMLTTYKPPKKIKKEK